MARRFGRGWGVLVALAMAALMLWVSGDATALIGLPLAAVLVVLPPRRQLRYLFAALAVALALAGAPRDAIWQFDRVWGALLAVWFVAMLLLMRRPSLMDRMLLATLGTAASSALFLLFRPGGIAGLDHSLASTLHEAAKQQMGLWQAAGAKLPPAFSAGIYRVMDVRSYLAPALALLASMAALALAWGIYRLVTRADEPALPPLRDFRFRDELVWLLVAGVLLVLVPGLAPGALRAGANLLMFMGALYALRGIAVLVSMSRGGVLLLMVFLALTDSWIAAFLMAAAAFVGLTDTWLDLRARLAAPPGPAK